MSSPRFKREVWLTEEGLSGMAALVRDCLCFAALKIVADISQVRAVSGVAPLRELARAADGVCQIAQAVTRTDVCHPLSSEPIFRRAV